MDLSTVEWATFGFLLAICVVTLPVVVAHVRGRTSHIDQAVQLMASSTHFQARLAGGMHLTWGNVFFASLGVVLSAAGMPVASRIAGTVSLVAMVLDLSVFAAGRPSFVVLRRHRDPARRWSSEPA